MLHRIAIVRDKIPEEEAVPKSNEDGLNLSADEQQMPEAQLIMRVFQGESGLVELFEAWESLMSRIDRQCFYHTPVWFNAFLKGETGPGGRINFFAIYRGNNLVAVIPLEFKVRGRFLKVRQASLPVREQLYMSDCAIADEENKVRIIEFLLRNLRVAGYRWDIFAAADTLENSCIATALHGLSSHRVVSKSTDDCSLVAVSPYSELLKRVSPNFRKNINKRRRKLEGIPDVAFSIESDLNQVEATFDEFLTLESSGWKAGKSRARGDVTKPFAIALNEKKKNFYKRVVKEFAERGQMRIVCIRVGPRLIAARIWLLLNQICYSLKTAYDEDYSSYSPGTLAFDHGYRQLAEAGEVTEINTITSGHAAENWKPEKVRYLSLLCFNNSVAGKLFYLAYRIRAALKKSSSM